MSICQMLCQFVLKWYRLYVDLSEIMYDIYWQEHVFKIYFLISNYRVHTYIIFCIQQAIHTLDRQNELGSFQVKRNLSCRVTHFDIFLFNIYV